MDDEDVDLPDEIHEMLRGGLESGKISIEDLVLGQLEALITEAHEDYQQRYGKDETSSLAYSEPYKSGPAMVWRLTDQIGIDADHVAWWFAALALSEDGSPFYIVHDSYEKLEACRIRAEDREPIADAFEAAERHHLSEREGEDNIDDEQNPPDPEALDPEGMAENHWETVANPDAGDDVPILAIRRAPALDHESLATYVLEQRQNDGAEKDRKAVGTFWGHHGGMFAMQIRDAIERIE